MNEFLAQYFGTNASAPQLEEREKEAEAQMFVQLAKEAGVDLNQMTDGQINELYAQVMGKYASDDEDDEEEKKRKAEAELSEKKESQAKFAEAREMGQIMAHSLWNELGEIEKDAGRVGDFYAKAKGQLSSAYGKAKGGVTGVGKRYKELLTGDKRDLLNAEAQAAADTVTKLKKRTSGPGSRSLIRKGTSTAMEHANLAADEAHKVRVARGLTGAGGGLILGGTGYGGYKALSGKKKETDKTSSALNELAFELAVEKCASAGWDADEAARRIAGVINLGLVDEDDTKIAYAQDVDGAVDIRSLELIEAAGYPVNWS